MSGVSDEEAAAMVAWLRTVKLPPRRPLSDAEREEIGRYARYLTAGGFGEGRVIGRLERLKFEEIVTGKTVGQVLAEAEES